MRAIVLVLLASLTAHSQKNDGSALTVVGSVFTAAAGIELAAAVGLFAHGAQQPPNSWDRITIAFGGIAVAGSLVTAAIACPMLVTGLNRRERSRKAGLSLAPTQEGAMMQLSGVF